MGGSSTYRRQFRHVDLCLREVTRVDSTLLLSQPTPNLTSSFSCTRTYTLTGTGETTMTCDFSTLTQSAALSHDPRLIGKQRLHSPPSLLLSLLRSQSTLHLLSHPQSFFHQFHLLLEGLVSSSASLSWIAILVKSLVSALTRSVGLHNAFYRRRVQRQWPQQQVQQRLWHDRSVSLHPGRTTTTTGSRSPVERHVLQCSRPRHVENLHRHW